MSPFPVLAAVILLSVSGCSSERPAVNPNSTPTAKSRRESALAPIVLRRQLKSDGPLMFVSWNGTAQGADSDHRLILFPDHRLILEHDGIGPETYDGTYRLSRQGRMTVSIPSYPLRWPDMLLRLEGGVLKLYRQDGVTGFSPESPSFSAVDFWPFVCRSHVPAGR